VIGVVGNAADLEVASEFFELFKTPWERAIPTRRYSVILSARAQGELPGNNVGSFENIENLNAPVILIYGSQEEALDREAGIAVEQAQGPIDIRWGVETIPIRGRVAWFGDGVGATLKSAGRAVDHRRSSSKRIVRRIGYDLFREVDGLLTDGQPASQASTPTLELHISVLRCLLLESGVPFVEIPPRPSGYDFICCLTHDVDFCGIRRHRFDSTLAGFVARASVGTLADFARGRRSFGQVVRNWAALLSLPFVFAGLTPDFWRPFDDYARVENGQRSTFFVVPFKGRPGVAPDGSINSRRAVRYEAQEIREDLAKSVGRGNEIGVHGIDAWRDVDAGRAEMRQVAAVTGKATAGVRMHWLYFDRNSPQRLEEAGFDYDSTWGYNETVGYRAGTSQVFRLSRSEQLLELPLSIMDSALFYRGRMNLGEDEALQLCRRMVANAKHYGGTLVINWHERSLAPERLWGRFYQELLKEVRSEDRAWFATAQETVDWFRWRRSIHFASDENSQGVTLEAAPGHEALPAAVIRIHRPSATYGEVVEERRLAGREVVRLDL
jgi:hypothetical protein